MSDVVLYTKEDHVAIIKLNRPEKRNALSSALLARFGEHLETASRDHDVHVVVIEAAGEKAFTGGFDLKESMENNITDIVERRADTQSEIDLFKKLWYHPKPIVCAVQGWCIGGGNTISFLSDMIIASDDATFGNPEILLGFTIEIPIEVWKMPFNKAMEWTMMSKTFTAEEMREMGVVNEVVPFAQLHDRAMEVARRIAQVPTDSMVMLKHTFRKVMDIRGFANTVDFAAEMFNLSRTHMQRGEMSKLRDDISKGGLKSALDSRYGR